MRSLRVLLLVCAATPAQSALADDQPTLAAIRAACAQDAQKLCAGVQPGGGRIVACLKEHKTRCPIGANRPPRWLRTQAVVPRPALPVYRPLPEPMSLAPRPVPP